MADIYFFETKPEDLDFTDNPEAECPHCGGEMTWCELCGVYSARCCNDYGTCECS